MKGDSEAVCELRVLIDDSTCVCSKFAVFRLRAVKPGEGEEACL